MGYYIQRIKSTVLVLLVGVSFVIGAESTSFIKNTTIKAIVPDVKPWGFVEDGKLVGIIADMAREIIAKAGYSMHDDIPYPFARLMTRLKVGKDDFGIFVKENSNFKELVPVIKLTTIKYSIFSKKYNHYEKWQDYKGKNVGFIRGGKHLAQFENDSTIIKYPVDDYQQLISMLNLGRVDGVLELHQTLESEIVNHGFSLEDYASVDLSASELYIVYNRQNYNRDLKNGKITDIKKAVEELKKKQFFKRTIQKYLSVKP